jgi:CPA1 family monovalent cation:H+ antiporter
VSLAAAHGDPVRRRQRRAFPARDLILFLTFHGHPVTLVGQGLLLAERHPRSRPRPRRRRERHAERVAEYDARRAALAAALERLEQLAAERDLPEEVVKPLRAHTRDQLRHVDQRSDGDPHHRKLTELREEVEFELIAAERARINELFRSGTLTDEIRRTIERELDLREADLACHREEPCEEAVRRAREISNLPATAGEDA